jgi:hypothetical protein
VSTVNAFLAAVAEAGHPAELQGYVRGGLAVSVAWRFPGMPAAVGSRARNLTGLRSAEPTVFVTETGAWLGCTLWDNDRPPVAAKKGSDAPTP